MFRTTLTLIIAQAGAEYAAAAARNAGSAPAIGFGRILDGVLAYVSDHTLIAIAGVLAFFMVARFFFTPRVR